MSRASRPYRAPGAHRAPGRDRAASSSASFLVPWKREFFESELIEPYRYVRVLSSQDGTVPRVGGYLFAVSLYEEFHINKIATDPRAAKPGTRSGPPGGRARSAPGRRGPMP